jgi:hypothetical protein
MKFFETMKFFEFFPKYMGKIVGAGAEILDKLEPGPEPEPEPEPKFLTSWSWNRSRTEMDRLRNADFICLWLNLIRLDRYKF